MEAIYFGSGDQTPGPDGRLPNCSTGAYVMPDMENMHEMMTTLKPKYVRPVDFLAAFVKGMPGRLAFSHADAQTGPLETIYDGPRPNGYEPSLKEGAIVLGVGGDNSPWGAGTFFEGVITRGFSSAKTDAAVLANVVAAGYTRHR